MTAKEYLSGLQMMKVKIEQLQEQRQMYLEMAASITAPLNPVRVQTSGTIDRVGNNTCKAADLAARIDKEVAALWDKQHEITEQIQALRNVNYIQVLYKVYVQFKTVRIAAQEMKRSYNFVLDAHKKALAAFEAVYSDILTT